MPASSQVMFVRLSGPHDFIVSTRVSSVAAGTDTDSFGSANQQEKAQRGGETKTGVEWFVRLAVLVFRIDLFDRPEYRFLEFLDLGVRRVLPDFLEFFVQIK
jgi:hypothetical protein